MKIFIKTWKMISIGVEWHIKEVRIVNGHPRGSKNKFWQKMTPNIDIMQKSSQFGPLDNTK